MNRQQRKLIDKQNKKLMDLMSKAIKENKRLTTPQIMKELNVTGDMVEEYKTYINNQIKKQEEDGL
jgi:uncharacterized protein involved in tolerance to divalent cations